ncbi:DUF4349 domain-containing protein [Cellulomonas citrea]|uniref:DUF4349 domain-containing protein n=1 Tax=Cellulomonas citrea TaxID=1909423 RepID=UPI0013573027|nr:DUF4349 domain-containing protein [Cellulomonas citrea]
MTGRTRSTGHHRVRLVALLAGALVLVAGCSAAGGTADSGSDGGAAAGSGSVAGGQGAAAQSDQDAGTTGDGATSGTAADRQVITTGTLTLVTEHPTSTVTDVVTLVEKAGGRVDARTEQAGSADDPGSATLTVRVPSTQVSAVIDALRGLGTVSTLALSTNDVTAAAQDLDARIKAQQVSVARMEDVLAHATTTADIMAAEEAVRQRQSDLEAMVSERTRMADQVALSTLTLTLTAPPAPAADDDSGPSSFPSALATGWHSLVSTLGELALVLGVLLPWLVFLALIATPLVLLGRRRSRRRAAQAAPAPAPVAAGTPPPAPPVSPFSL